MASHVQVLLDTAYNILINKSVKEEIKNVVLISFKYTIEQLEFYNMKYENGEYNYDSPMGILWPMVENIYKACEKCAKKENLRD